MLDHFAQQSRFTSSGHALYTRIGTLPQFQVFIPWLGMLLNDIRSAVTSEGDTDSLWGMV